MAIVYKANDIELHFKPLENGNNEYLVNLHDFGNLESVMDRVVNGIDLNTLIELIEKNRYCVNYLRYL